MDQSPEDQLVAAARRRADALCTADVVALRDLLHPRFRWTSHRGDVFDREAYVDRNTSGDIVWVSQSLTDVSVAIVGDTGVITSTVRDDVERDATAHSYLMRVTQTWVRHDGRWQCLAGHAGPLLS